MRFPAAVVAALVLAALPAPAQAAGCVWTASGLPTHRNLENDRVDAMSPDGTITVGDAVYPVTRDLKGILWLGSTPVDMADPNFGPGVHNWPWDVNNAGVVVGYTYDESTAMTRPYRYHVQDGSYEWLQPSVGFAAANYVNERGDVAGWISDNGGDHVVLWPAGSVQPQVIGTGQPAGLDEAGRVVTTNGEIWSPDGTTVRIKDRRAHPERYAEGHVIGAASDGKTVEWNLAGKVTRTFPGAGSATAVNSSGVFATKHGLHWAIWTDGAPQDVDGYIAGITDSGVAYGNNDQGAVVYRCV
ncbi:hypothetical protein ABZ345_18365 [Lentzea sp. NPDC005914]|uniref:hypothetical protein n=1 Tax=Lentzea sp. NPDC005914 TaxID=3154572 RepID=UPI00340EE9AA